MTPRLPALAAVLAGLLSIVEGLVQVAYTQPESGWGPAAVLFEIGFALSLAASIVASQGLPTRLGTGRAARIGTIVAQVGFALLLVASVASAIARQNVLQTLFPAGLLLALIGLLVLAVAGAITGRQRWLAVVPFAGFLLSIVLPLPELGDVALGIAWLITGALMSSRARTAPAVA